jgi:hypothetical protein
VLVVKRNIVYFCQVIGAYCSTDWAVRLNQQRTGAYFGTGESFICQLSPSRVKYSWVGLTLAEKTPYSAQLFLSGDSSQITIGGGLVLFVCLCVRMQ